MTGYTGPGSMFGTRNCEWYKEMNEGGEPFRQGQQHTELRELVKRACALEPGKFVCPGTGPPGAELMRLERKKGVTHGILQAVLWGLGYSQW